MSNGAFPLSMRTRVAAMEDVLDLCAQPYDLAVPLVCFDEKPGVLHGEVREPLPVKPGYSQRSDYEYECLGTANLFVNALAAGWSLGGGADRAADQARLCADHPVAGG